MPFGGEAQGLTKVKISFNASQLRAYLFDRKKLNPLSETYRDILRLSTKTFRYRNKFTDLVLRRFIGEVSSLPPLEEFVYSSLRLPQTITLNFYYRNGIPTYLESPLAYGILSNLHLEGKRQVVVVARTGDYLIYEFYSKSSEESSEAKYGIVQRFSREQIFVKVEIHRAFSDYPYIHSTRARIQAYLAALASFKRNSGISCLSRFMLKLRAPL